MRSRWALVLACVPVLYLSLLSPVSAGDLRPRTAVRENPYFPLQVGNQWVYRDLNPLYVQPGAAVGPVPPSIVMAVTEQVPGPDGYTYFALENYFGARRLVRAPLGGSIIELNPGGDLNHLWYLLLAPVGTKWILSQGDPADPCVSGSEVKVASRTDTVRIPAGEFRNVVRLEYAAPCADAGILAEWFAPGVGLIKRQQDSLGGPWSIELVAANVRDRVLPRRAYTTSLILDRAVYVHDFFPGPWVGVGPLEKGIAVVDATLLLSNGSNQPVEFLFDGCKSATFSILDAAGNEVLKVRGDDGGCCACLDSPPQSFVLLRNALLLRARIRLALPDGSPLPDGQYAVAATLDAVNLEPPLRPSARTPARVLLTY